MFLSFYELFITYSYQLSKSHLLRCYDLRKGVRGREVSLELTNGQATALMYHQNFFCFFSRARTRTRIFLFFIFLYIFRGLSKPYKMGILEPIKGRNLNY